MGGEDGSIQGFLEVAGIPYTGSDVYGSWLAMDKIRTKEILDHHGVPTPRWIAVASDRWRLERERVVVEAMSRLGLPIVAKAPRQGSTIGVSIVRERSGLSP